MRLINDLISKNEAIESIQKIPKIWNGNECLVSFQKVVDYISRQPAAYDVDKFVERLETNSMFVQADDEPFVPAV